MRTRAERQTLAGSMITKTSNHLLRWGKITGHDILSLITKVLFHEHFCQINLMNNIICHDNVYNFLYVQILFWGSRLFKETR